MERVSFKPARAFEATAAKVFAEQRARMIERLPLAEIEHIGSTAVPDSLTKGDLDVNVRVKERDFPDAVKALGRMYDINQPDNWTETFASFKDDGVGIDFGVQLTVIGSYDDVFILQRDALLRNPDLVKELNAIKMRFEGRSMDDYREAKGAFFMKVLNAG